ncbi:MAG TPA: double zinc ribbon domain-containing protein, partial [Ktedonobacterales bacterium]|nr:double zinc ribbon domain-containing protein [Ktedonobacterales bacterium]
MARTALPAALGSRLLDLLFPPSCAICGRRGAALCPACLATVRAPAAQQCALCDAPLPVNGDALAGRCATCQVGPPGPLAGLRVAARYEDTLRLAIIELKFHYQRRLAEPLGDLLAAVTFPLLPVVDVIAPVPLHPTRRRERGCNQAELLARRCGRRLGRPVRADL